MWERFREGRNVPGVEELTLEELAALSPEELQDRARRFFNPENKDYSPGDDPGITRVRFDSLKTQATEDLARDLNRTFGAEGSPKDFLARGVDRIQIRDAETGQYEKSFSSSGVVRKRVEFPFGDMIQVRDKETGQIITATKVEE